MLFFVSCIYLVTLTRKSSLAAFQPSLMPLSDIKKSVDLLTECNNSTDAILSDISSCEQKVNEVWKAARCRNLNVLIDATSARLNRLDSFMIVLEAESITKAISKCSAADTDDEEHRLEAELAQMEENVVRLSATISTMTQEERNITGEIKVLEELSNNLTCEHGRLLSEMRILTDQLSSQDSSAEFFNSIDSQLHNYRRSAEQQEQKAYKKCSIQVQMFQEAHTECEDHVFRLGSQLPEPGEEEITDATIEESENATESCHKDLDDCRRRAGGCLAQLGEMVREKHRSELVVLEHGLEVSSCQSKTASTTFRIATCLQKQLALQEQMQALAEEQSRIPADPVQQLHLCENNSKTCEDESQRCQKELAAVRVEETRCDREQLDWLERWRQCNATVEGLVENVLPLLESRRTVLEQDVNRTLARGHSCLLGKLELRADLSFLEERLRRLDWGLGEVEDQIRRCNHLRCYRHPSPPRREGPFGQTGGRFRGISFKSSARDLPPWLQPLPGNRRRR